MGVAPEALPNLVKPFFRGDAARTAATGAGLGLAIVDKTVQRMGGIFALSNTTSGGLAAHIKLQRAKYTPTAPQPEEEEGPRSEPMLQAQAQAQG